MTDSDLIEYNAIEHQVAKTEGRLPRYRARFEREGRTVIFPCGGCRHRRRIIWHIHGVPDGLGGHRAGHCGDKDGHPGGYMLAPPFLPFTETGLKKRRCR